MDRAAFNEKEKILPLQNQARKERFAAAGHGCAWLRLAEGDAEDPGEDRGLSRGRSQLPCRVPGAMPLRQPLGPAY